MQPSIKHNAQLKIRKIYQDLRRRALLCSGALLFLSLTTLYAGSATWSANPVDGNWNNPLNWTPAIVPDDVATFDASAITSINLDLSGSVVPLNSIIFNPGASAYTITLTNLSTIGGSFLSFNGSGISNNSGVTQNFVTQSQSQFYGEIDFHANASAGANIIFTNRGNAGRVMFLDDSTASSATLINEGGTTSTGNTYFFDNSTADNATLIANSGPLGGLGGGITFQSNSSVSGGTARVQLFGNGTSGPRNGSLNVQGNFPATLRIGSVEGSGQVFLGQTTLMVGANNLSTSISGVVQDFQGTLNKIGKGRLLLSNANSYGSTIVTSGTLLINNRPGSGTGSGPVTVNGGILGGTGIVAGDITIGTATNTATLEPGGKKPGRLTAQSAVSVNAKGILQINLDSSRSVAAQLVCGGLVTVSGAMIEFADLNNASLPSGTVFTVVDNTSAQAIRGRFANLPDGAALFLGNNAYLANYEGGDGNDLTLTVVP